MCLCWFFICRIYFNNFEKFFERAFLKYHRLVIYESKINRIFLYEACSIIFMEENLILRITISVKHKGRLCFNNLWTWLSYFYRKYHSKLFKGTKGTF